MTSTIANATRPREQSASGGYTSMAKELKRKVFDSLNDIDLAVLTSTSKSNEQETSSVIHSRVIKQILADHPTWRVAEMDGVSLKDRVWLLQLYELTEIGVKIPQIKPVQPSELLSQREAIQKVLDGVKKLKCRKRNLEKCPDAICLLRNLEHLDLARNLLTSPPNVRRNTHLKKIILTGNRLSISPDITKNLYLEFLFLGENSLTVAPNIRKNTKLQELQLDANQLRSPPNVSKNVALKVLRVSRNPITTAPDISQNPNLREFRIEDNPLSEETKHYLSVIAQANRGNLLVSFQNF